MLVIISGKLHSRSPRRRITYRQDEGAGDRSMSELLEDQKRKDELRKQHLERQFREKLRRTACWRHDWRK